jgi:hypothetical protein
MSFYRLVQYGIEKKVQSKLAPAHSLEKPYRTKCISWKGIGFILDPLAQFIIYHRMVLCWAALKGTISRDLRL